MRIERLEVLDRALVAGRCRRRARQAVAGRHDRGARPARQVPAARRSTATQTLVMHLRMTGNLVLVEGEERCSTPPRGCACSPGRAHDRGAPPARPLRPRRRPRGLVHRPAPLRRGLPDRRRRADRALRPARGRAALARLHAGGAGRDGGGPHGAAEVVPARPVGDRRGRQHLRRRGALPGAPAPALAGRLDEAGAPGGAARRGRRGAGSGDRRGRLLDRRLPRRARREGPDAGEFLVHTREGEPCPGMRRHDRADRRLRPLDLLLPELPGEPAQTPAPTQTLKPGRVRVDDRIGS